MATRAPLSGLETESIWPQVVAAVGPDYGVGDGIETPWAASTLENGLSVEIPANYGTEGSEPEYRGLQRDAFTTGTTSERTARIRSIGWEPGPLPAEDTRILQYNLLPYGAWYFNRIPSANKAATYGNDQTVEMYGVSVNFQEPGTAQLLAGIM